VDPKILDRCLLQIQSGEATLEDCLAENTSYAELLEPLLSVAAATRAELAPPGPSQAFLTHSPMRVMNLTKARLKASSPTPRRRPMLLLRPAYRLAGVLLAMALLFGSVGAAYASGDALPGDNLYGVKRGLERAALAISLSAEGDAELWLEHAGRRIAEVEELVRRGRGGDIGPALKGYEHAVRKGLEIAAGHDAVLGHFETALDKHGQVLAGLLAEAPEQAVPDLTRALENSRNGRDAVEQIRSGQHPSESAPGQLKVTTDPSEDPTDLPPGQQKKNEAQGRDLPPGQLRKTQTPDSNGSD
jgi:hypothetical protein